MCYLNAVMRSIRIKLYIVTILLLVAGGLSAIIYFQDTSLFMRQPGKFYCGTSSINPGFPQSTNIKGRELFSSNCASCHSIYKDLTGPSLENFHERFPMELFTQFMKAPEEAVKQDPYLHLLAEKYNYTAHPSFSKLSNSEVGEIIDYVKQSSRTNTP
jgi:hypothetical protein